MARDSRDLEALTANKEAFINRLAETFEPRDIVDLFLAMGLRQSDLALALGVHPRTVRAWTEDNERDPDRQRDGILSSRPWFCSCCVAVCWTLGRPRCGLVEPHEQLGFRRPLAVFAESGLTKVVSASAAFVRPEPPLAAGAPTDDAVAAGATKR